ncbi:MULTISPECIES: C4-dicarboxylate TRAP transporter substrate-binding protein [unclassified Lysinibacillus]|uniref:C4-dicarboxylate TRAP transporter substrate-binding protein n=1 Tax=unclassified Lysinibacillus TaxID=2636778 RepID=UPI001F0EA512|nr:MULTISPECIES: C4-dicarboxylate TRAP transporter substrate-binding protein [unclassified Lysinibacillus]
MKLKSGFLLSMIFIVVTLLAACSEDSSTEASSDKVYTLKINTALAATDPIYQGLEEFKEQVAEKTNNQVVIEIYGNGALGDDSDVLEQAKVGANVAVLVDAGRLAELVPEIGILSAPYIVDSYEEGNKVAQSDLFKGWSDKLATEHNLQILSFNWYQGDRHFLTNKKIEKPADLKGLKIRTPGATVWTETISAMGASPAGMAFSEVYPGIQQGVIDGAEAQHPASYGANLHEVVKYITKTSHFQLITGIVAGADWMAELPEEYQKIVYKEALKAGEEASENTIALLADFESKMKDAGVEVNEVDIEPFKQLTESVYYKIDGYAELREEVNKILGK